MATVLSEDTAFFRCLWGYRFPLASTLAHSGKTTWIYPDKFFRDWHHDPVPEQRIYVWSDVHQDVEPALVPVKIAEIPKCQFVYGWEAKVPLQWDELEDYFPREFTRGSVTRPFYPVPYYRLPQLACGWTDFEIPGEKGRQAEKISGPSRPLIPKDEQGAIMYLGNKGQIVPLMNGAHGVGDREAPVLLEYSRVLRSPEWQLHSLAQRSACPELIPSGTIFITARW